MKETALYEKSSFMFTVLWKKYSSFIDFLMNRKTQMFYVLRLRWFSSEDGSEFSVIRKQLMKNHVKIMYIKKYIYYRLAESQL